MGCANNCWESFEGVERTTSNGLANCIVAMLEWPFREALPVICRESLHGQPIYVMRRGCSAGVRLMNSWSRWLRSPFGQMRECSMEIKLRTKRPDRVLKDIVKALEKFASRHPNAEIEAYRQNSASVRIRVINPEFNGLTRAVREEELWDSLNELPDETVAEISLLLLLTPAEAQKSFASLEFDDPIPSEI